MRVSSGAHGRKLTQLLARRRLLGLTRALGKWSLAACSLASTRKLRQAAKAAANELRTLRSSILTAGQPSLRDVSERSEARRRTHLLALARYLRACRTNSLSHAVRCWAARALRGAASRGLAAAAPRALGDATSGGATSHQALRRAGVQAMALAEARAERDAHATQLAERDRQLALAQRQLTQQSERRRAVEAGGKHAAGELERLRHEAGCAPPQHTPLDVLHPPTWLRLEAGRAPAREANPPRARLRCSPTPLDVLHPLTRRAPPSYTP